MYYPLLFFFLFTLLDWRRSELADPIGTHTDDCMLVLFALACYKC